MEQQELKFVDLFSTLEDFNKWIVIRNYAYKLLEYEINHKYLIVTSWDFVRMDFVPSEELIGMWLHQHQEFDTIEMVKDDEVKLDTNRLALNYISDGNSYLKINYDDDGKYVVSYSIEVIDDFFAAIRVLEVIEELDWSGFGQSAES